MTLPPDQIERLRAELPETLSRDEAIQGVVRVFGTRRQRTAQRDAEIIAAFTGSVASRDAICQAKGITKRQFYRVLRRVIKRRAR